MPKRKLKTGVTGSDVLKSLNKKKYLLCDDGRCWVYGMMATLGTMAVKPKRGLSRADIPSKPELREADRICQLLYDARPDLYPNVTKAPDYKGKRGEDDFFGAYGGPDEWLDLSKMFGVSFVLWEPSMMNDSNAKFPYIHYDGTRRPDITAEDIQKNISGLPDNVKVVHMVWNAQLEKHFDVYL